MPFKSEELNRYFKLKTKIQLVRADLGFLKKCRRNNVYPKFIKINCPIRNVRSQKAIEVCKRKWLTEEINGCYKKLSVFELECYNLHMSILNNPLTNMDFWFKYEKQMREVIQHKLRAKHITLNRKYKHIQQNEKESQGLTFKKPLYIDDLVHNFSKQNFSDPEMQVLNKGLNFAPPNKKQPTNDLVVDVETAIKYNQFIDKANIRNIAFPIIQNNANKNLRKMDLDYNKIIKDLTKKDCYYTKADKGNAIVILDKEEYDNRMYSLIKDGKYVEIRNPLPKMIRETSRALNDYIEQLGFGLKMKLLVSNPKCPALYGLPKIHKPGNAMRPIVSNINSPSEKVAKWLVAEFKKLCQPPSFSVKNSIEFTNKVSDIQLEADEVMVSFDVTALFPSVPLQETFTYLENWLVTTDTQDQQKEMYLQLTKLCMRHSYFTFRQKYYKQLDGTAMGNALAPFLSSDIFLGHLETSAKQQTWFPRVWIRYVDDIFAVVKQESIPSIIQHLNSLYDSIKFTVEVEHNGTLPFLDILVKRNNINKLLFSVYRKPTHTQRFITSDSNHCRKHKEASFNSMVHRLVNVRMTTEDFSAELAYIKETALINGFSHQLIDRLIRKHRNKKRVTDITTLEVMTEDIARKVAITYHPTCTGKLKNAFKRINKCLVPVAPTKLRNLLCKTKDSCDVINKSGVYSVLCSCGLKYIGQSSRAIIERWKEHNKNIAKNEETKSSVAHHILNNIEHSITRNNFKMEKCVPNRAKLDAWESLFINENRDNIMNTGEAPINSCLFNLCKI